MLATVTLKQNPKCITELNKINRYYASFGRAWGCIFFPPGGLFAGFKNHRRTSCLSLALCKKDKTLLFLMRKDVKQPKKEK